MRIYIAFDREDPTREQSVEVYVETMPGSDVALHKITDVLVVWQQEDGHLHYAIKGRWGAVPDEVIHAAIATFR